MYDLHKTFWGTLCFSLFPAVALAATIGLTWDPPDTGPTPDGYRLYRSTDNGQTFVAMQFPPAKIPGNTFTYDDTTVTPGQNYCYAMVSTLLTAESSYSEVICGYVPVIDTTLRAPLHLRRRN